MGERNHPAAVKRQVAWTGRSLPRSPFPPPVPLSPRLMLTAATHGLPCSQYQLYLPPRGTSWHGAIWGISSFYLTSSADNLPVVAGEATVVRPCHQPSPTVLLPGVLSGPVCAEVRLVRTPTSIQTTMCRTARPLALSSSTHQGRLPNVADFEFWSMQPAQRFGSICQTKLRHV